MLGTCRALRCTYRDTPTVRSEAAVFFELESWMAEVFSSDKVRGTGAFSLC